MWFYLIPQFDLSPSIDLIEFLILVFSTILIAAGGNIVNDIKDLETDKINKPEKVWIPNFMRLNNAWLLYFILTFSGLISGILLSIFTKNALHFLGFLIPAILLYLYAVKLKKILFVNNIIISFLISYSILIVIIIADIPLENVKQNGISFLEISGFLLFFSFALNWNREIIKDVEDMIGDQAEGVQSIPIKFGIQNTKKMIQILLFVLIGIILAMSFSHWYNQTFFTIYLVFAVLVSLLLFLKQLHLAQIPKHFEKLSVLLKIIMLIGIFSVFLIQF